MAVASSSASKKQPTSSSSQRSLIRAYWELTRLHKFPSGSDLVFWPCAWGLTLGALQVHMPLQDYIVQLVSWAIGSTLLHSAACVINDICDRDFDRQVERCKTRPIASGQVSVFGATVFLFALMAPCMALLSSINPLAILIALPGIVPLHALYPLMKRWTNWPQAWLGFAMNWGFLPAWVSVTGRADWALLLPMILAFPAWTLVYDTIYACQDRKDDKKAGVKSTALLFGDHIKSILTVFAAVVVGAFAWMGVQLNLGLPYWVITVGLSITHFAWQLITVDLDHGLDCWTKFRSNGLLGLTIWSGIFACYYQGLTA